MNNAPAKPTSTTPVTPETTDTPDVWVLCFRPLASIVPPEIRIRRLLKIAGRSLNLKCVSLNPNYKPPDKPGESEK